MKFRQPEGKLPEYLDMLLDEGSRSQEEQEFVSGLRAEMNTRLKGAGLQVFYIGATLQNEGYRIGTQDKEGRRYFCGFTYDEGIFLGERYPNAFAQELVTMVCERALLAREVEFEKRRSPIISLGQAMQESGLA